MSGPAAVHVLPIILGLPRQAPAAPNPRFCRKPSSNPAAGSHRSVGYPHPPSAQKKSVSVSAAGRDSPTILQKPSLKLSKGVPQIYSPPAPPLHPENAPLCATHWPGCAKHFRAAAPSYGCPRPVIYHKILFKFSSRAPQTSRLPAPPLHAENNRLCASVCPGSANHSLLSNQQQSLTDCYATRTPPAPGKEQSLCQPLTGIDQSFPNGRAQLRPSPAPNSAEILLHHQEESHTDL